MAVTEYYVYAKFGNMVRRSMRTHVFIYFVGLPVYTILCCNQSSNFIFHVLTTYLYSFSALRNSFSVFFLRVSFSSLSLFFLLFSSFPFRVRVGSDDSTKGPVHPTRL